MWCYYLRTNKWLTTTTWCRATYYLLLADGTQVWTNYVGVDPDKPGTKKPWDGGYSYPSPLRTGNGGNVTHPEYWYKSLQPGPRILIRQPVAPPPFNVQNCSCTLHGEVRPSNVSFPQFAPP